MSVEVNNSNVYFDQALVDDHTVRNLIASQQAAFYKARGSNALATMIAHGYVNIRKIITNATPEVQAEILDEHGVAAASGTTSKYTPWIKVQWGEPDLGKKKFKDSRGVERTVWVPDRSMEIYFHTMEALEARGVATTDIKEIVKVIIESGGSLKMARDRQKRINTERNEARKPEAESKRTLFLRETKGPMVDINIERPKGMGEFMTLLVRPIADSQGYEVMGIVDKNATAALDKLAKEQFEALTEAARERERKAEMEAEIERRVAERQRAAVDSPESESRRALNAAAAKIASGALPKLLPSTGDKAA